MSEGFICRRGGGGSNKSTIIVTAPTGSTVTATCGTTVKNAVEKNGQWTFKNCDPGTWTVKASLGASSFTSNVGIPAQGAMLVYYVSVVYRTTPEFTYTGNYKVVDDNDNAITDFANWNGNWKIRFLTSGDLKFTNLFGWNGKLDAFLVGGGGSGETISGNKGDTVYCSGGGGGGYTQTLKKVTVTTNTIYKIQIGAGGAAGKTGSNGGQSSAFNTIANGGKYSGFVSNSGGDGGSGGGGGSYDKAKAGGAGGSDGSYGAKASMQGGKGQGTTTREFAEPSGKLYAGGGGGGNSSGGPGGGAGGAGGGGAGAAGSGSASNGTVNTGGGGGGGASIYVSSSSSQSIGGSGGSGIVIIRNAR